ncbi:YceD family protein [Solemya velesiana gill symbiont]|uniref:YceD family protein n=1 Tax=Solemya velesiana gill symbiont TaxID=1918948 RepID=UPI00156139A6|nr:YceD family protein [Solemya velesiana gill symbiont]
MTRLASMLESVEGDAEFELRFERDDKRRSRIKGFVKSTMTLECQRCLESMQLAVDAILNLGVIEVPEEAERLPEDVEPVQVEEGLVRLLDLVEEELILAIPQVPMHEPNECRAEVSHADEAPPAEQQESVTEQAENPFAVLAGLKTKTDSEN